MRSSISQDHLRILLHGADTAARRLVRQLRLSRDDLDDIRQDLLTDLLARMPGFDQGRGTLGAFAAVILKNRAARLANQVKRVRRLFGETPVSIDEATPDSDGLTFGDQIGEDRSLSALFGQPVDAFLATEQRIDLERALESLDPIDAAFCTALSRMTVDQLVAAGHGSRSSLYRRVKAIRNSLVARDLKGT